MGTGPILLIAGVAVMVGTAVRAGTRSYGAYDFSGLFYLLPFGAGSALSLAGVIVWALQ